MRSNSASILTTLALMMLLSACTTRQPTQTQPKLTDLATPTTADTNLTTESDTQPTRQPQPVLYIFRLLIPLESDLTQSLSILNTTELPADIVRQYNANGVHIGHIDMQGYQHLMANFPMPKQDPRTPDEPPKPITDARAFRLTGLNQTIPLSITPPVSYSFSFNYTTANNTLKTLTFSKGRCRFLTRTSRSSAGKISLQLTPQHHLLKHTLIPRTPEETVLDGTVFNDLTFSTTLDKNKFLVMACDIPHPQPPQPQTDDQPQTDRPADENSKVADDSEKQDEEPQPLPQPIQLPNHFGTHWLSAKYRGQPVQMVLIFHIQNH